MNNIKESQTQKFPGPKDTSNTSRWDVYIKDLGKGLPTHPVLRMRKCILPEYLFGGIWVRTIFRYLRFKVTKEHSWALKSLYALSNNTFGKLANKRRLNFNEIKGLNANPIRTDIISLKLIMQDNGSWNGRASKLGVTIKRSPRSKLCIEQNQNIRRWNYLHQRA